MSARAEVAHSASDDVLRQLCWRDFFAQLLAAAPELEWRDMYPGRRIWRKDSDGVAAWKDGSAGYPFVDAAMRELLAEGWIPNRQRLVAAALLVKQLRIDWRIGAAHFMKHLLDGDAASNSDLWRTGRDPVRRTHPSQRAMRRAGSVQLRSLTDYRALGLHGQTRSRLTSAFRAPCERVVSKERRRMGRAALGGCQGESS